MKNITYQYFHMERKEGIDSGFYAPGDDTPGFGIKIC